METPDTCNPPAKLPRSYPVLCVILYLLSINFYYFAFSSLFISLFLSHVDDDELVNVELVSLINNNCLFYTRILICTMYLPIRIKMLILIRLS